MLEPDVTLTDYGLTVLCAALAHLVFHRGSPSSRFRLPLTVFFVAVAAASFTGGTVHGFFPDDGTVAHDALWVATLLFIGLAGLAGWIVAVELQFGRSSRAISLGRLATTLYLVYAGVVLFVSRDFLVAIVYYMPAVLALLAALIAEYRRTRERPIRTAAFGLALTLLAAAVQQLQIPLHPEYFDHNALYHLVQAAALILVFVGARHLARRDAT